ncbi:MAG TPA: GtrA family protein [Anaerolineales bacterium]|nr:GtrA family protein [Anaerolineales bacterium]
MSALGRREAARLDPERARREWTRFLKFSVVGTIGAVVDFGSFNLLHSAFHVASIPASMISFVAAGASNFLWNRYWTYPDSRSKLPHHQVVQFAAVSVIGLAIRTPVFAALERPGIAAAAGLIAAAARAGLPLPAGLPADALGRNLALAAAVLIVLVWNFLANRFWTYSDAP